ncbi:MAG TPA: single-stranded DNA-binding protein [Candidatus Wallbacteria bacterium]|nr:single-stranded DNA-binding protein [Candidatus Wallbacteria bacterium]
MGKSVNKVFILGNAGNDPEASVTKNGKSMSSFRVATNELVKNQNGGYDEITQWHKIKLFGTTADIANQYVKKGSRVFVEGRVSYSKIESKETGKLPVIYTNIIGNGITLLSPADKAKTAEMPF